MSRPAASWDISLHPRLEQMATAGDKGKVTIMSSAKDNFGEVISTLEATGTFGTAVEYVRGSRNTLSLPGMHTEPHRVAE